MLRIRRNSWFCHMCIEVVTMHSTLPRYSADFSVWIIIMKFYQSRHGDTMCVKHVIKSKKIMCSVGSIIHYNTHDHERSCNVVLGNWGASIKSSTQVLLQLADTRLQGSCHSCAGVCTTAQQFMRNQSRTDAACHSSPDFCTSLHGESSGLQVITEPEAASIVVLG